MLARLDLPLAVALLLTAFGLLVALILVVVARSLGKRQLPTLSATTPEPEKQGAVGCAFWFFLVIILAWSYLTLTFDVKLVWAAVNQLQALSYPTTEGKVVRCKAKEQWDEEGITYDVDIEYTYHVQNQQYTCTRVRYLKIWGREWVSQFVAKHPPNTPVTVFYDPDDPARAVLLPGLAGQEPFLALALFPFNVVMVWLWCMPLVYWFFGGNVLSRLRFGVCILEEGETVRVRLPTAPPAAVGMGILLGGSIVAVFPAVCAGLPPSLTLMGVLWSLVLGCAGLAYLRQARRVASGEADLIIDHREQTLTLPQTFGRQEAVVVRLADLLAIQVAVVEKKDSDGRTTLYVPTLHWRDASGGSNEGILAEWSDEQLANQLAAWIGSRAGLAPPD
jgi:hypothetical protein